MNRLLALAALLSAVVSLSAQQVQTEIVLERQQFLAGEELWLGVRISNHSGRELVFGKGTSWLRLSLVEENGGPVRLRSDVPIEGEFSVPSTRYATRRFNLAPCYELSKPGRYRIAASVHIEELGRDIQSAERHFDIITGTQLWDQEVGVPPEDRDALGGIESLHYALVKVSRLRDMWLYLQITDVTQGNLVRVQPISVMVSFSPPMAEVDSRSCLHVLNQFGAKSYVYCVYNPRGDLTLRQHYNITNSRPKLRSDAEGRIYVGGGERRPTLQDIPEPEVPTNAAPTTSSSAEPSGQR